MDGALWHLICKYSDNRTSISLRYEVRLITQTFINKPQLYILIERQTAEGYRGVLVSDYEPVFICGLIYKSLFNLKILPNIIAL